MIFSIVCSVRVNTIKKVFKETLSPSMDIQISSNLERYLYDLCDQDPKILRSWMTEFQASGKLTLTGNHLKKAQTQFESVRVDDEETVATIREVHSKYGYLLDPHSALGMLQRVRFHHPVR